MSTVVESSAFIAENSTRVRISDTAVKIVAAQLEKGVLKASIPVKDCLEPSTLENEDDILEWLFLLDTLNFCFWSDEATLFSVRYKDRLWTGYRSLCAALAKAAEEGTPVYRPSFYKNITYNQLKNIFVSETHVQLPLLNSRVDVLREAATTLEDKFDGSVRQLVIRSDKSAQKLVDLLAKNFLSFCDTAIYKGRQVSFMKRAQIFVADVWSRFEGTGIGEFYDIDSITMFADYRVPQCLCYFGVLEYDSELQETLSKGIHLSPGSEEEVEIRGCSIAAVELIKHQLNAHCNSKDQYVNSALIDFYMWNLAKDNSDEMAGYPIHRTETIFY